MAGEQVVYSGRVAHVPWGKDYGFIEPNDSALKESLGGKQVYFHWSKCYVTLDGLERLVKMPMIGTEVFFTMGEVNKASKIALHKTENDKLIPAPAIDDESFRSFVPPKQSCPTKSVVVETGFGSITVEVPANLSGYALKHRARQLANAQLYSVHSS